MGISTGSTVLLCVALAAGPVAPSQAAPVPSHSGSRIAASGASYDPPLRAQPPKPSVTRLTPQNGPTTGGTDVVIKGHDLSGVKRVLFGATRATDVRVKSARKLVVRTPAQKAGLVRVRVVTDHGSSKQSGATHFTYVTPTPSLTRVSPAAGPTAGSTRVTLTGTDLTGATSVRFGSAAASSVVVASPTTIIATTPAHAVGMVDVSVATGGGSASLDEGFTYTPAPTLSFVDPGSGPLVSTPVTLVGTALTANALVTFGGVPATVLSASPGATELTVATPDHAAGFVDVAVSTVGGSTALVKGYLFVEGTTLTSVAPTAGPSLGGATVTLTGSGFTGETLVTFGNKPSLAVFPNLAGTQLTALLPSHVAGAVDVSVATEGGSATLPGGFTYVDAPTLTTVTPTTGPTGGGTSLTLTGTVFRAGMQVRFGGVLATGVTVVSATQATAVAPAHAAGAVDVSVTTPGGTATLTGGYTYVAAPSLTAVSPNEGPATGGQSVTLTGTNFQAGMQVRFGATLATLVSVHPSGTLATVTTPAHAPGLVGVTVTTPGGSATFTGAYTYVVAPILNTVSPNVGPIGGGTTVTLTGTDFRAGMQVLFGVTPAALVSVDPLGTSATVTTPAHAAGVVDVSVTTPGGTSTSANAFTYLAAPSLTAVSPNEGPTTGAQTVTLTGTGFRAGMQVGFGGVAATGLNVVSTTQATVVTPAHPAGVVDVSVTTPGGSGSLPGGYTYVVAPTLTSLSPSEGPTTGGQTVTLTGTNFRAGMQVTFGGAAASGLNIISTTQATVVTPVRGAGAVDVVVSTPGGTGTLNNGYTYVAAPNLIAVNPDLGPTAGGTMVTLTGTGLTGTSAITFDGVPATNVTVVDATTVTALNPGHPAGTVDVSVTTVGGSDTLVDAFTYVAAPTLASINPTDGPVAGGTTVTLTGTGLTGTTDVTFDGVSATGVVVVNDSTVTATTPAHGAGVVDVSVTTPGGSSTLANAFTYVAAPTLTTVFPSTGPAIGGTTVILSGTGLTGTTTVTFDGVPATGLVVVSDTEVTVDTPAHDAGLVDVELTTRGGTATLTGGFTYLP